MESIKRINKTYTYPREGDIGMIDVRLVMKMFRCGFKSLGGIKVESVVDHNNAVEYRLAGCSYVEIRQSGPAPKLEVCISVAGDDVTIEKRIREDIESIIYMDNRMGYCCE